MAHKQWSWNLYSYEKQHSSLMTTSAPLHILSCSSSHWNINGNGFCFSIFTDPIAMILIRVEKFEEEYINSELDTQSFHFIHFMLFFSMRHSQYSGSFSFLIFPTSLHCQDFKSWKSRDDQLLCWQSLAYESNGVGLKINVFSSSSCYKINVQL